MSSLHLCLYCPCLLQEQQRDSPVQQLQLLVSALQHESAAVRHVGLGELMRFLRSQQTFLESALAGVLACSVSAAGGNTNGGSGGGNSGNSTTVARAGDASLLLPPAAAAAASAPGARLSPAQCRALLSELLAALLASCDGLPRGSLAHSMRLRCVLLRVGGHGCAPLSALPPPLPTTHHQAACCCS